MQYVFGFAVVKLSDIATIKRGGNFQKKDFVDSGKPCIHYGQMYTHFGIYTIVDAINDKNVLPFRIDFVNTVKSKDGLKDRKVNAIDTEEAMQSPKRIEGIVNYIIEHFDQKTKRNQFYMAKGKRLNGFNSIFAVSSIPVAKKYYYEFKKQLEEKQSDLKILDYAKIQEWQNNYYAFYNYDATIIQEFTKFNTMLVIPTMQYKIPVILLGKETPKEAVCQVFENVNTGGVSLTVFELVTAIFAMDDFELRKDWEERKEKHFSKDLLTVVDATAFLTACTLLSTYKKKGTVSCKKKDVLNLSLEEYKKYKDLLTEGFLEAEKILQEERIFLSRDLPYTTQFVPMAVLCALLIEEKKIAITSIKDKIKQWYWCGVFGEMYGGANETRYVYDVVGVMDWIADSTKVPKTVQDM